jgi:hypothetical protein
MKEFECPDGGITVGRGVIEAFLAAFGPYKGRGEKVVCRHLAVPALEGGDDAHYPLEPFLDAMEELQLQFGGPFMRKVGSFIFDKAVFPPGIDTLTKGMELINVAYYMNHSESAKDRIGGYYWQSKGERSGEMMCDNPYPCAFDIGIIDTIAKRFEATANVTHQPGACRHDGGEACTYRLEW